MLSTSSEELVAAVEVARFTAPITVLKDKAHTAELEDGCYSWTPPETNK